MIRPLRTAALAALVMLPVSALGAEPTPTTTALVGRLVSIEELPDPCEPADDSDERECFSMDTLFRATYQIVRVVHGTEETGEIVFDVADHYGFPAFAEYQHALLFVSATPTAMWLEKYQGFAVFPTRDGSWATCGNPYDERTEDPPRGLRRLEYATDLGIVGEFSAQGLEQRFPKADYLMIEDGRIRCTTGVVVEDLYEMVRSGVLAARGVSLPPLDAGAPATTP